PSGRSEATFIAPVDPPAGGDPVTGTVIQYGLGSLTPSFDTISSFPVVQAINPPSGRSFPPVVGFDPAQVTTNNLPALQQPNVDSRFNQVPQSSKWWSSLIFPRSKVAPGDSVTPQDSQGNRLFALTADPFTAMVNSNGSFTLTGTFSTKEPTTISLARTDRLSKGATVSGPGIAPGTTIETIAHPDAKTTKITVSK